MAMPQPEMTIRPVAVGRSQGSTVTLTWIAVSVAGAIVGALAAWQIRSLIQRPVPPSLLQDLAYFATLVSVLIASGAQWLLLRHWRWDVFWWVPATVGASLVTTAFVVPGVLNALANPFSITSKGDTVVLGAIALGAAALVAGAAQALALRGVVGNAAWYWIPATALGGALAGASTTALASQLFGLPAFAVVSLVAAISALAAAGCQAPVLLRFLR